MTQGQSGSGDALAVVTAALPGGGDDRPGQRQMAEAVTDAIRLRRHLVVQAGTGTGKSLAYLVPALLSGSRVVVATATKALQDQLATRDLPFLQEHLSVPFEFAVLKGRANYLCRQKASEVLGGGDQLDLTGAADAPGQDGAALGSFGRELRRIIDWGNTTETGDRAELSFEPHARAWAMLSVGTAECPGATRCPSGGVCLAEAARDRASKADVVVVNTHLYATHLAAGRRPAPPPRRGHLRRGPRAGGGGIVEPRPRDRAPAASRPWPEPPGLSSPRAPSSTPPTTPAPS